ncbi:MAG: aminopeptidase, partial [Nodosilinea sp.]
MPNAHHAFEIEGLLDTDDSHKSFEMPGAKPHYNPDRPGQVEHIALDLSLDLEQKICEGICEIRINPVRDGVDSLALDAVNQQIESVHMGADKQDFDYDGEQLHIKLKQPTVAGQSFTVAIAYRLTQPERGIYFIGPDKHYPDKPVQVWTQG